MNLIVSDADRLLFDDILACDELRPAAFVPGALTPTQVTAAQARAETLLQALAHSEDARSPQEDGDEHSETSLAIQRVEAKLDLLLGLFGTLLRERGAVPPAAALRWSTRGVRLDRVDDWVEPLATGSAGVLRLQPADWLPDCLELPARVIATTPVRLWLRFEPMPTPLQEALERHLFRLHRRQVAESRRAR